MVIKSEIISSRNNDIVKWASSLSEKKNRSLHGVFAAEGDKLCFEAIESKLDITHIFISENRSGQLIPKISPQLIDDKYAKTQIITVTESVFEKISTEKAPQGVFIVIKYLDFFRELDIIYNEGFFLSDSERALSLYSVRDPGNIGAIVRSAAAFGISHIILSSDCADIYSPKTVRSAMGSLFKVKFTVVNNFESFVVAAKNNGRRVFAAELSDNAFSINDVCLNGRDIFVIGNEGHGIDKEISSLCTSSVFIPISKSIESLNASVAASIILWEQSKG